ncbi:DUF4259 domain-containing protein [Streptomyces sp. NPDC002574]|uniref:DUF4259 domain-containing protein n=1 Tax=Streptomyces sp. NPDC002574 TaxID=3364652 RepID=UPI0036AB6E65
MGSWGAGNFDEDTAADHLGLLTGRLTAEVARAMEGDPSELEPDEYWGVAVPCNLELLHLLATRGWAGATLPGAATVRAWKARYLAVWDAAVDELEPGADYRVRRREVLERTFDGLAKVAERRAGSGM